MSQFNIARFDESRRSSLIAKTIGLIAIVSLLTTTTFAAAPQATESFVVRLSELKQDIIHSLSVNNISTNAFSLSAIRDWLPKPRSTKSQTVDRIVIRPVDTTGSLTVMQGERVVFSATGYSGDKPTGGINVTWTVQDAQKSKPARSLIADVFEARRHGAYIVTATSEDGLQAFITVNVIVNQGYGLARLLQKKDTERTAAEKQSIDTMRTRGVLISRNISSKALYNAENERLLYEADKAKRSRVSGIKLREPRQYGDPARDPSPKSKTTESSSIAKNVKKSGRGGPSWEENDSSIERSTGTDPLEVRKTSSSMPRPIDYDGWDGSNWYTADDPVNQTGTPALSAPAAGASNGDYQINAPVLSLKGRGIDVDLGLVYNSRLWSKSGTVMSYDADRGFPAPGWSLGFGKMMYLGGTGGCMLVTPDGTRRSYDGTNYVYSGSYYQSTHTSHTTDGSFIDYYCNYFSGTSGQNLWGYATLPNGTFVSYGSPSANHDQLFPTQITDAQGNYINITYVNNQGPQIDTISDTLGRTITFNYETGTGRLISITGPGYNNTTRTYVRLHYTSFTLSYAFASGYTTDVPGSNTQDLLDSIYYPDTNTGYWFGDSDSYSSYGMIAKVLSQRGMSWSGSAGSQGTVTQGTMTKQCVYDFPMTAVSTLTDAPEYTTTSESWANMDPTSPVQTHYAVSNTSTDQTIEVTLPDGTFNKQTSHVDPGNPLDGVYYQGETYTSSSGGTLLSKTKTFFGSGDYGTSRPTRVEVTDELGQMTATDLLYAASSHNQLITQKEYGYGGTALYRQTNNTYDNNSNYINNHIFNLLKSTEVVDAAGSRLTRTEYQYDNNAEVNGTGNPNLVAAIGVVHHYSMSDPYTTETTEMQGSCLLWYPEANTEPACDHDGQLVYLPDYQTEDYCSCEDWDTYEVSVYNPNSIFRGNVTKVTEYSNAAGTPSGAIDYDFTYDITGNQRTATTNCCQQMSFDYTDSFSDATNHHAYAFPTVHTKGSSDTNSSLRMSESAVYDFNTGLMTSSTDFNGRTTTYTYDTAWRPTVNTAPTGATTTIDYDDGNLSSTQTIKLSDNTTIVSKATNVLNGEGQTILSKYLAGATNWNATSIKYDEMGRKQKVSLPYDSAGSPSQWTQYAYDHLSRVTQVTAPDGSTSMNAYNETTRPDSASSTAGQTVRSQDAWGRERWARTDDFGRLAEVVEPNPAATGNSINVASAANGAVASASSTQSGYPASAAINGDRNGANWTSGGGWIDGTANSYPDWLEVDFAGSKTISEIDAFTVQDNYTNPVNPTQAMTFSVWGITAFDVQYWDGSTWVTVPGGSVTGNNKVWRRFTFTAVTTDKIRVLVSGAANSFSRITEVEAWTPTLTSSITGSVFDTGSLVTNYSYDVFGRLTQSNQGGQIRNFKYDSIGRLTRQKLAEQTATINDLGAYIGSGGTGALWSSAFFYDDRSNVTQKTDARGVQVKYSYQLSGGSDDPLNRLQSITYDLSGMHDTSKPIPNAPTVTYEYITTGDQDRLKKVTSAGVSTDELTYDTEGRVTDETKTLLGRTNYPMVTGYTYDTLSRTASVRLPAQYGLSGDPRKFVYYDYDSSSRFTTIKYGTALNKVQQAGDITYDASDQTTSINIGPSGANQVNEQYTFDPQTGLLTNQKAVDSSRTLLDLSYDYNRNNSVGSLDGKTGHLTRILNNLDHDKDREYKFDAVGRLTNAKGGMNSTRWGQTYEYDRYGNRTSVTAMGVAADNTTMLADGIPSLTFNTATNHITTSNANGQFEYDESGNQTRALDKDGANWIRYEYDAANRPVNIKQGNGPNDGTLIESQQFGVGNERIALTDVVSNQTTWYSNAVEYIESGTSGVLTWSKTSIHLGDTLLSTITPDGAGNEYTEYNHPGLLGTELLTDQSAGTYSMQANLPFGQALDAESTVYNNPKRFTSYERSSRTNLDYAVNRTYDPKQGRFTQVDPIGMGAADFNHPQTLNLYNYCGNDPVNHVDSNGLFWGKLFKAIGNFFKKAFKWIAVALSVAIAVLTCVFAPYLFATSLKLVFGVISALANAASSVLNAFGLTRAGMFVGMIGAFAAFGSSFLAARSTLNWKTALAAVSSGATATGRTLTYLGHKTLGQIFGLVGTAAAFVSNGLQVTGDKVQGFKYQWKASWWKIYKFSRSVTEQIANLAGATKFAGYLNVAGIVDDVGDAYGVYKNLKNAATQIRNQTGAGFLSPPNEVYHLNFWSNTKDLLTGTELEERQSEIFLLNFIKQVNGQVGRVNSVIGRVERGVRLAH